MAAKFFTGMIVIVFAILISAASGLVTPSEENSIEDVTRVRNIAFDHINAKIQNITCQMLYGTCVMTT